MAIGQIYTVTHKQTFGAGGKPMVNVYNYLHAAGTGGALDMANAFEDIVLSEIIPLQTPTIKHVGIDVINLFSMTDFASIVPVAGAGTNAATDTYSRKMALNFTFKVSRRDIRPGSKRIGGLPEIAITNGVVTDSSFISGINNLRDVFNDDIASGGNTFTPVVVKRVWEEPDPPDHNGYYRYPETLEELDYGTILAVLVNLDLSTQGSRK